MRVKDAPKVKKNEPKHFSYSARKKYRKDGNESLLAESSKKDTILRRLTLKTQPSLPNRPQIEERTALRQSPQVELSLFSFEKEKHWIQKLPVFFLFHGEDAKTPIPVEKETEKKILYGTSEAEAERDSLLNSVSLAALFPESLGGKINLGSIQSLSRAGLSRSTIKYLIHFNPSWSLEERKEHRIRTHAIFGGFLQDFKDKKLEEWILSKECDCRTSAVEEAIVTAAIAGNEKLVSFFLDRWKANPNAAEYDNDFVVPALWRAVVTGSVDMVRLLLERGADPLFSEGRASYDDLTMVFIPWDFVERDSSGTEIVQRPEILRLMRESIEASGRTVPEPIFSDEEA